MKSSVYTLVLALLILMSLLRLTLQRRPIPPLREKVNKDSRRSPSPPLKEMDKKKPHRTKTNSKTCQRCSHIYRSAEHEFYELNDITRFCKHLGQAEECIRKIHKEDCNLILILTLGTGISYKQRIHNCSNLLKNADSVTTIRPNTTRRHHGRCRYRPHNRKHKHNNSMAYCGMFGDPHLKTFYDERQTCIVAGAWTLIENDYLAVQVTNEIVQHTEITSATATTKISIIFKERKRKCISQKIYEASSNFLPNLFKDGTSSSGTRCKTFIKKRENNSNEVLIRSCRSNTTIVIRKFGKYLTFNILTPFEFVNKSTGLCRTGCPSNELVDYHAFLQNRINQVSPPASKVSAQTAMDMCGKKNLTDFYYDSCVFDILTTGDQQFTEAAHASMLDAKNMDIKLRLRRENSAVMQYTYSSSPSSSSASTGRTLTSNNSIILMLILCSILSWLTSR